MHQLPFVATATVFDLPYPAPLFEHPSCHPMAFPSTHTHTCTHPRAASLSSVFCHPPPIVPLTLPSYSQAPLRRSSHTLLPTTPTKPSSHPPTQKTHHKPVSSRQPEHLLNYSCDVAGHHGDTPSQGAIICSTHRPCRCRDCVCVCEKETVGGMCNGTFHYCPLEPNGLALFQSWSACGELSL